MSSRIVAVSIDATDPETIATFWCGVLGWSVLDRMDDGVVIGDGSGPTLDIFKVPEPKAVKNRIHIDLRAEDRSTPEELERILALGATPVDVGQGGDVPWTVLADPEGNEFCLLEAPLPKT